MTQPLALVFYERLMPGSQLVNRLQDLKFRVDTVNDLMSLVSLAQTEGPMVVFVDLESVQEGMCQAITTLKSDATTQHIPVVAFGSKRMPDMQVAVQKAGANLVVAETALLDHLPDLLNQVLQVE
jgi:CheY-like chemotaxis protein